MSLIKLAAAVEGDVEGERGDRECVFDVGKSEGDGVVGCDDGSGRRKAAKREGIIKARSPSKGGKVGAADSGPCELAGEHEDNGILEVERHGKCEFERGRK